MKTSSKVETIYPLSPSQTGMLMQAIGSRDAELFVEQVAFCIEGSLDVAAFETAWQTVSDRHPALRSAFLAKGRGPVQAVLRKVPIRIRTSSCAAADEDHLLNQLLAEERTAGFPLNRPPLIRFAALRVTPERLWWLVTFHHIILDGWSLPVMFSEATRAYLGNTALEPAPDYNHYIAWLKKRSTSAAKTFWRERLSGLDGCHAIGAPLGADRRTAEVQRFARSAGTGLAAAAKLCRVSPAVLFEVLWAVLLGAKTNRDDVVFGTTVSGRPPAVKDIDRMLGLFINTVPVRLRLPAGVRLDELIGTHAERRAEQAEYEFCSAGQIQSWSGLPAHESLYQSLLVYENLPTGPTPGHDSGLPICDQRQSGARSSHPLTILVSPGEDLHLRAVYYPACLAETDVAATLDELVQMIHQLPGSLERPVAALTQDVMAIAPAEPQRRGSPEYVAPRTRLEHELALIWEEMFGHPVGVLDDFFQLGGHSLLALQMPVHVQTRLGFEMPLDMLVQHSTIETLAAALSRRHQEEGAFVELARGPSTPVYCIHPLGGHVLCYAGLAKGLSGSHPCWGLQAPGLVDGETPAPSWDELIAHHWALLNEHHNPSEALALLGYSYGGYIALELAERAVANGWSALPVMLLDVPQIDEIPADLRHPDAATLLHSLFGPVLSMNLATMQQMTRAALLRDVHVAATEHHLLPRDFTLQKLERLLQVAETHAGLQPPSKNYGIDAVLLRARDHSDRISPKENLGWNAKLKALQVCWVDGSHETMLNHGQVDGIVKRVLNWLDAKHECGAHGSAGVSG